MVGSAHRESSGWSTPDGVRVWEDQEELHTHLSSQSLVSFKGNFFKKRAQAGG